jgi:lambda family phage portal protein
LLEIDHLRMGYTIPPNIVDSVEKDQWGRPIAYWILPIHPGSINRFSMPTPVRVPAGEIIHPKIVKRIGQTRGITQFHAVFDRFQDVNDIDLYERTAAKMGAAIGLKIERPLEYQPSIDIKGNVVNRERIQQFWPGMVLDGLDPGEKAEMLNPAGRPNPEITKFRHDQLRSAAAGLGISFSALSNVFDGNYSAQRQDMVQNESKIDAKTESFITSFINPVYKWAVEAMLLYGFLDLSLFKDVDLWTIFDAVHHGPALPWIDPQKEIEAKVQAVEAGFKSRAQVIRENGDNPDAVRSEIAMERQRDQEQGLSFNQVVKSGQNVVQDPSES